MSTTESQAEAKGNLAPFEIWTYYCEAGSRYYFFVCVFAYLGRGLVLFGKNIVGQGLVLLLRGVTVRFEM